MQQTKTRILNVEDNEFVRYVTRELLDQAGYEVILTSTVADGLRRAARWHFDLIILSYMLPDGTGLELFQQIRQFDPHTPILFFVSTDHKLDLLSKVGLCAQGYLVKPLGIYELVATVDRLLDAGQSLAKCAAH